MEGFNSLQPGILTDILPVPVDNVQHVTLGPVEISAIGTQRASYTQRVSHTQRIPHTQRVSRTQRALNTNLYIPSSHTSKSLERPNTEALFSTFNAGNDLLPSSAANVLHADGISELLKLYPNRRFVDTLLSIILHGARIGYEGAPFSNVRPLNHSTAFAHPLIVEDSISDELQKGRMKQIPSLPPGAFCSPIGLVPKMANGVQVGWRVIFDLCSPEGSSVNNGIPIEFGTITYETLSDAIRLVAQAGKGAVMMKCDLKSAFRHVPIHPCDYWLLIFEWNGKFFVDMFLPFGLHTAPRIFNLFAEALHWVFETLFEWNCTHYLDDFLFVFPPGTDTIIPSLEFDSILAKFGLSKAVEKDSAGCVVIHLGFEFDSENMQVRLPADKKQRAINAVNTLLTSHSVSLADLKSTLGFLSHCCQVVPLGCPFLRNLFSLICGNRLRSYIRKTRLSREARIDLKWWHRFLTSWSSIAMIQLSRVCFDTATDASGEKGIGGVYHRQVFSERIPSRHKSKKIDWKEMFAILHAFLRWHEEWKGGTVRLACDNSAVVDSLNKHSIKGPAIVPLQRIFLIAAVYDIHIVPFWIPSEENMVADAASRHNYEKLANLGLQVTNLPRTVDLRQKLSSFFTTPSRHALGAITRKSSSNMRCSVGKTAILPTHPPSKQHRIGPLVSCPLSGRQPLRVTLGPSVPTTFKPASIPPELMTTAFPSSSEGGNESMVKAERRSDTPLRPISSSAWSTRLTMTKRGLTSNQHSVWHLPPSFDLETLHGIPGHPIHISPASHANTLPSTLHL